MYTSPHPITAMAEFVQAPMSDPRHQSGRADPLHIPTTSTLPIRLKALPGAPTGTGGPKPVSMFLPPAFKADLCCVAPICRVGGPATPPSDCCPPASEGIQNITMVAHKHSILVKANPHFHQFKGIWNSRFPNVKFDFILTVLSLSRTGD